MERNLCECAIKTVFSENVENLSSFKSTDIVIVSYQWETAIVERKKKNITEQPKRGWKWALLKKSLNLWSIYLLTSVSITSNTDQFHSFTQSKKKNSENKWIEHQWKLQTFWKCREDVLVRRIEDVFKMSWRCLEDVFAISLAVFSFQKIAENHIYLENFWLQKFFACRVFSYKG